MVKTTRLLLVLGCERRGLLVASSGDSSVDGSVYVASQAAD